MSTELQQLAEQVMRNVGVSPKDMAFYKDDLPIYQTPHGHYKYPLQKMAPGQHFFVPSKQGQGVVKLQNSLSCCVNHARKVTGFKYVQRRYPNGVRVWRIA